eukprot:TRINITY_DN2510_c0_g1_i2.p1 TRINITY_DN2510_c0_g1~~TRINITY_DN2510_c0_g1_i2.p1  ORF type:complete len:280 (-),score=43.85 TRINITY_DN2510_c0_g1_i2:976-1815(-)
MKQIFGKGATFLRRWSTGSRADGLLHRSLSFGDRTAIISGDTSYTYSQLHRDSDLLAKQLLSRLGTNSLSGTPIAYLTPPTYPYVKTQWAIWKAGGLAVPLATSHPEKELVSLLEDSGAKGVVYHNSFQEKVESLQTSVGPSLHLIDEAHPSSTQLEKSHASSSFSISNDSPALLIYTSGTTGKPKGVVMTHGNVKSQVDCLVKAWEWKKEDRILNVLPLHHVHGLINVVSCALSSGAVLEMADGFNARHVWTRFLSSPSLSLFMAVPTIYGIFFFTFS